MTIEWLTRHQSARATTGLLTKEAWRQSAQETVFPEDKIPEFTEGERLEFEQVKQERLVRIAQLKFLRLEALRHRSCYGEDFDGLLADLENDIKATAEIAFRSKGALKKFVVPY